MAYIPVVTPDRKSFIWAMPVGIDCYGTVLVQQVGSWYYRLFWHQNKVLSLPFRHIPTMVAALPINKPVVTIKEDTPEQHMENIANKIVACLYD
jgi:hypothetical protein